MKRSVGVHIVQMQLVDCHMDTPDLLFKLLLGNATKKDLYVNYLNPILFLPLLQFENCIYSFHKFTKLLFIEISSNLEQSL